MREATNDQIRHYLHAELLERLRSDTAVFDFLEQGSLDGIWYWDLEDPAHEWLSPRFKALFGYAEDEMENSPEWWQANIDRGDLKTWMERLEAHERGETPFVQGVVRYRHRDGSTVWVNCRGIIIRDREGKPIRMLGAHNDVTDLKRTEQTLLERTRELERSNTDLESLAYVISHDLKAPLRAIDNISGWLAEDLAEKLTGEDLEQLDLLRSRVQRLTAMIEGVLHYSRAGREKGEMERVEVGDLVAEVTDLLAPPEGFSVVVEGELPTLITERIPLQQVLMNLIGNAISHHDREEGIVKVGCEDGGDVLRFIVSDDGPGIPPEKRKEIFQVFRTLQSKDEGGSTGIGLAIVERIVGRLGGEVEVESREPRGTTFSFDWPKEVSRDG